ncbi:MAG: lipid IV(A) 3-deoxy-D-manno-octulosonic acid transferase [Pseudomonadota bacterium]
MPRFIYSLLTYLALPLVLVRLMLRARKAPAYRQRWGERLGWYSADVVKTSGPTIVFHAVSVGEVHAAQPLIEAILQARPDVQVVVTAMTPTGSDRVKTLFGERVRHVYLPYDLPGAVERFLDKFSPAVLVLLETELWPNLIHSSHQQNCRVILANARLSARSQQRYRRFPNLTRSVLENLDVVLAQSVEDGERFQQLGLHTSRLQINGTLKFDVAVDKDKVHKAAIFKTGLGARPVWIAASTREGEEGKVLEAFAVAVRQLPSLLLVLVPRHPERFVETYQLAESLGYRASRYSSGVAVTADTQVLIGDTMGDMQFYFSLADIAFVGGSLVDTGCQNIIEPAALGLPILTGPSLYNFQAVSDLLVAAGGMEVVADARSLGLRVAELLRTPQQLFVMGEKAKTVVATNQGATTRLSKIILEQLAG